MAILTGKISIPKTAYSMYDIAKIEKIPAEKISQLMKETLKRTVDASPVKTIAGIENYFNTVGCCDGFVNAFHSHWHIQPFAKGIRITAESAMKENLKNCTYATFYVPKKIYEDWKKKKIEYEPASVNLKTFDSVSRSQKTTISLPTNYVVKHFKDVVKGLKMNLSEVVITALDFFMKNHSDIFGKYGADIDERVIQENKMALAFGYVDKEMNNKIWKAIQRYNQVNTPPIKYGDFLESALAEKLERMPAKYTNPELFEEYKKLLKESKEKERELVGNE